MTLRELPRPSEGNTIPIELTVTDTGKGIGKEFLRDQLFQPFSQENPLQTGTGLGLAIVRAIILGPDVNGKVDVVSHEGTGTSIKVQFDAEVCEDTDDSSAIAAIPPPAAQMPAGTFGKNYSVAFRGFDEQHRGHMLSLEVLGMYTAMWQFELKDDANTGDILIINEDEDMLAEVRDGTRPVIFFFSFRTPALFHTRDDIIASGGYCATLSKPIGPTHFRQALQGAVNHLEGKGSRVRMGSLDGVPESPADEDQRPSMSRNSSGVESDSTVSELSHKRFPSIDRAPFIRRRSEETEQTTPIARPSMAPRGVTYHPTNMRKVSSTSTEDTDSPHASSPGSGSGISTISLIDGGVMLRAAAVPASAPRPDRKARVLVVEDNVINRRVLGAYLRKRGIEYQEAHNGQAGVELFEKTPANYWDVILMDISMPIMNGHQATQAIRKIESRRRHSISSMSSISTASSPLSRSIPLAADTAALGTASNPAQPTAGGIANSPLPSPLPPLAGSAAQTGALFGSPSAPTTGSVPLTKGPSTTGTSNASSSPHSAAGGIAGTPVIPAPPIIRARSKIFALTGLATPDDKREAFGSGVDG